MTLLREHCPHCGKVYHHYGDALSCPNCFIVRKKIASKPEKPKARPEKQAIKKRRQTDRQKDAAQNMSDQLQTAKSDMIRHIKDRIHAGYYSVYEFMADPKVYFDSAVMGKWVNNPFLHRSIVTAIRNHYQTEAPF
jgi:hypothetical protein